MEPRRPLSLAPAVALALLSFAATGARAQPFGSPAGWLSAGPVQGWVEIPSSPDLVPNRQITIEFWTQQLFDAGCTSTISKGRGVYWVGFCAGTLRSYLRGFDRGPCDGGGAPSDGLPHHFAVTSDGDRRKHYVDGELVAVCPESGAFPADSSPVRFFYSPDAAAAAPSLAMLFEVRLWRAARSQAQIRQTLTREVDAPLPGLVAVWHLRGDSRDAIGGHHGGPPRDLAAFTTMIPTACVADLFGPCLLGRIHTLATYVRYTPPRPSGVREPLASGFGWPVPGASSDSVLFWFFDPANWEVLAKTVDGCALNGRRWVFSAATTDQHYTLWAIDRPTGTVKAYVNFAGDPAPAVTDTSAFATCP